MAGRAARGAEQELLVTLARAVPPASVAELCLEVAEGRTQFDWGFVLDQGYRHGVLPMVARNLLSPNYWPHELVALPHRRLLLHHYEANRRRNDVYLRELQMITRSLTAAGLWWASRKGPVLIADVLRDPGCRAMSDLDLLVTDADLSAVRAIITEHGYRSGAASADRRTVVPIDRQTAVAWRLHSNVAVPMRKPSTDPFVEMMIVDCCVNLFLPDSGYSMSAESLRPHCRTTAVGDVDLVRLDNEAFLLDLCAHLFKEATTFVYINLGKDLQLRKFADIADYLETTPVDWVRLGEMARSYQVADPVAYALRLTAMVYPDSAARMVGAPAVDDEFLAAYGRSDGEQRSWDRPVLDRLFDLQRGAAVPPSATPRM
jgi:hypothetical protein